MLEASTDGGRRTPRSRALSAFAVGAVVGGGIVGLGFVVGLGAMLLVLVPTMLIGVDRAERGDARIRALVLGVFAAVIIVFGARLASVVFANVASPPEWDFQLFWIFGRMAARHLDFYRPDNAWAIAASVQHSEEFKRAILDVGFWYPPPTMLLFWPLGWFDLRTASGVWHVALAVLVIVDIVLLQRLFLPHSGVLGSGFVAALVVTLRATHATVLASQTNFLVLLMLLLFWRDRNRMRGGVWLGLGTVVKPFVAVMLLQPLLRGRWRAVVAALATLAAAFAVAVAVFGLDPMLTYFRGEVTARMPAFVYTEVENQSLLATLLRWTNAPPPVAGHPLPRLFLALAAVTMLVTMWVVLRLHEPLEELGIALVICWTLLVYPATLEHYAVLLLAPLLWLWSKRRELPGGATLVTGLWTAEYVLVGAAHATYVFPALALCFVGLAVLGAWTVRDQATTA